MNPRLKKIAAAPAIGVVKKTLPPMRKTSGGPELNAIPPIVRKLNPPSVVSKKAIPPLRGAPLPAAGPKKGAVGTKLTGRANAITRGKGVKAGLKKMVAASDLEKAYAGIKERSLAKGLHPTQKTIEATYKRYHKAGK